MTSQQVEDARTQPMLLVAMGALISAMVLLCMVPAVLLCLLGSIAAVVAVSLAFGTGRTALRRFRRPASSRGDRALQGILGLGCAALFVGTGAVAMIVAGLTWRR